MGWFGWGPLPPSLPLFGWGPPFLGLVRLVWLGPPSLREEGKRKWAGLAGAGLVGAPSLREEGKRKWAS